MGLDRLPMLASTIYVLTTVLIIIYIMGVDHLTMQLYIVFSTNSIFLPTYKFRGSSSMATLGYRANDNSFLPYIYLPLSCIPTCQLPTYHLPVFQPTQLPNIPPINLPTNILHWNNKLDTSVGRVIPVYSLCNCP